jgi:hypothetical protein
LAADDATPPSRAVLCGINPELLSSESVKLLNLCWEWLHCYFPFVLAKIHRVTFGVLSDSEVSSALKVDPKMPASRKVTAVPL